MFDLSLVNLFGPLTNNLNDIIPKLPSALATLLIGLLVIRLLSWIASWLMGFVRMPRGLKGILGSLINALLMVGLVIIVLQSLNLNNLALIFSLAIGAIGLALGTGSSNLVSDVLGGIDLARDRDFNVGDQVIVGASKPEEQVEGIVESMDMRRTRLRTKDGRLHIFPNAVIERQQWVLVAKKKDLE
ncbi:MAG TPA: mechanosensitive ion channel domain-containing protein [Candidatus Dormibacteraeota bacterium]|nr:mechanosensitive ion channel domain-containing protein [Candidatus Dormibacteraeota bacterium]